MKAKCKALAFSNLMKEKEGKKKLTNINYSELKIQDYLVSKEMTTSQKQLIFQIRTKMIPTPDNMGQETWCKLCLISRDQMSHVLDCFVLRLACQDSYQTTTDVKLSYAYEGDIKKVKELALVFQKMWRKRLELLK